nr:MAG TPA: hypothetical protein [Herelleviridae sp.]
MPDPDNNSINRQPIIVNLRKRERTYDGQYDAGNIPERLLYHCTTWNNYKNNILKDKRLWKKI